MVSTGMIMDEGGEREAVCMCIHCESNTSIRSALNENERVEGGGGGGSVN